MDVANQLRRIHSVTRLMFWLLRFGIDSGPVSLSVDPLDFCGLVAPHLAHAWLAGRPISNSLALRYCCGHDLVALGGFSRTDDLDTPIEFTAGIMTAHYWCNRIFSLATPLGRMILCLLALH